MANVFYLTHQSSLKATAWLGNRNQLWGRKVIKIEFANQSDLGCWKRMQYMKKVIVLVFSVLFLSGCSCFKVGCKRKVNFVPPNSAEVFAPGVLSVEGRIECAIGFMPGYDECYICIRKQDWSKSQVYRSQYVDGKWNEPVVASFSDEQSIGAWPSPDGKRIYFISPKPKFPPANIWMCNRLEDDWTEPVKMGDPVSSSANEWSCCESGKDEIYTCSWRENGSGGCDIWRITNAGKENELAENIEILNGPDNDCNPVTDPTGKYMLFCSRRADGYGKWDLYISVRDVDGNWQTPQNLGGLVNTEEDEGSPIFSPDGKAIFFTRTKGEGDCDIYWVSLDAVLVGMIK